MRIVVTGAGGFIGQHVLSQLSEHEVIALDLNLDNVPDTFNGTKIVGDVQNPDTLNAAFVNGCDAVIHLATIPGGAAEANPLLAKAVNIDATMALIDIAAKTSNQPRFVFASSIAVFGKLPQSAVTDTAPTVPIMLYGAHKLMMENWIACQTRRGAINGISLRLPGVVARPISPSGMKSAFLSDIFHALRLGEDYTMPVSQHATSWISSIHNVARNICKVALSTIDVEPAGSAILMPALRVEMLALENEIRRQLGTSPSVIQYSPDETIEMTFGQHPEIFTPMAQRMGFEGELNLEELVKAVMNDNHML